MDNCESKSRLAAPPSSGLVYWITGFSGAGKTNLSLRLQGWLREQGVAALLLDGDRLRAVLAPEAGHSMPERLKLAMTYSRLCQELAAQGHVVVCATISMFQAVRDWNRANISGYREIYLRVPVQERQRRDPKGLYATSVTAGAMPGLDVAAEEPRQPDLLIDNHGATSLDDALRQIIEQLLARDLSLTLPPASDIGAASNRNQRP